MSLKPVLLPVWLKSGLVATLMFGILSMSTAFRFGPMPELTSLPLVVPTISYGQEVERYAEVDYQSQVAGQDLHDVLLAANLDAVFVDRLVGLSNNKAIIGDLTGLESALFKDEAGQVSLVAQVINRHEYLLIDANLGEVHVHALPDVTSEYVMASFYYNGSVDSMLYYAELAPELSARISRGITQYLPIAEDFESGVLRIIYTTKFDEDGNQLGFGDVEAIRYTLDGKDQTAIRFEATELDVNGFFTPEGSPAQRTWLTSPVPSAILSSPFDLKRTHPILKTIKPHYGTDYAAPFGTPILAVSDGTVTMRARTFNNGMFIKIKHDSRYATQYLHMKAFARNIKLGSVVKKGQVIGYVGSTGLSSGPHVCFRFWKDGQQVDHRAENLAKSSNLSQAAMRVFAERQATFKEMFSTGA